MELTKDEVYKLLVINQVEASAGLYDLIEADSTPSLAMKLLEFGEKKGLITKHQLVVGRLAVDTEDDGHYDNYNLANIIAMEWDGADSICTNMGFDFLSTSGDTIEDTPANYAFAYSEEGYSLEKYKELQKPLAEFIAANQSDFKLTIERLIERAEQMVGDDWKSYSAE